MGDREIRIKKLEEEKKYFMEQGDVESVNFFDECIAAEKALNDLEWNVVKDIRNANGFSLYPLHWDKVLQRYNYNLPFGFQTQSEFEKRLKALCDSLYHWGLYEKCPQCKKGIKVPLWNHPNQWTAFCQCTECGFSLDREGK